MMLTPDEQDRIKMIRLNLKKLKREGHDTTFWEAPFFLKIIDRFLKQSK